jgi:uncharacterized protein involved in exopolysaccharide biosynthesis
MDSLSNTDYVAAPLEITGVPDLVEGESARTADLLVFLLQERRFVFKALLIGVLVAAIVSLLIPPKYESTTRIMPPERQGLGGLASMLAAVTEGGAGGSLLGGMMSDAVGIKSSGAMYSGILKSDTVQDMIIDRFDLRHVYHLKYRKDARERLTSNTDIDEDRKSGIISITVADRSRDRAAAMANAYVDALNSLTAQLNTSAAHRERVFIEDRLKTVKQDLDKASKDFSEFSSENLTLDVKEQGKAMVMSVATLEGELIAAESQVSGLEQIYTANNVRVRSIRARIASLKAKIAELRGTPGGSPDANPTSGNDFDLSIAKLPALGVTYFDLFRRVKIQETMFEILTKQYELAKVEEAKELPTIKVLDHANVPEVKSSPKRMSITLLGGIFASMLAAVYLIASFRFRGMGAEHPISLFSVEASRCFSEDMGFLRTHTPKSIQRMVSRVGARILRRNPSPAPH